MTLIHELQTNSQDRQHYDKINRCRIFSVQISAR